MIEINAMGDNCPIPVIKTRNALKELEQGTLLVSVDNKIATENLEKMAINLGAGNKYKKNK